MPQYQDSGSNILYFPSESGYSFTYGNNSISNIQNINLFTNYGTESELGSNKFIVLIDPKL